MSFTFRYLNVNLEFEENNSKSDAIHVYIYHNKILVFLIGLKIIHPMINNFNNEIMIILL